MKTDTPVEITREELALILADMKTMWASLRDIAMTAPGAAATISTRMELPQVIDMVFEQAGLASSERVPMYVWAAENKTSVALFSTEEGAQRYVSSFPASVGGGITISKLAVLETT
jgi:hypothetical protein